MSSYHSEERDIPNPGVTIGISDLAKAQLQSFTGYEGAAFKDMIDAFRFAVSIAIAKCGEQVPEMQNQSGTTLYNLGSFDGSQIFSEAIKIVAPTPSQEVPLTRLIRAYGEKGIELMLEYCEGDPSSFDLDEVLKNIYSTSGCEAQGGV